MEIQQSYRELGYHSLSSWANTRLGHLRSQDTLGRLCATVTKLIAPMDARPYITEHGEKINGLMLIAEASPTAMMKVAGTFANSEDADKGTLVLGLMTGTSDDRQLKGSVGWKPAIGKAPAQFRYLDDGAVDIHIQATDAQARVIERTLKWLLEIQLSDLR